MNKATFVKEITVKDLKGNPVEMEVYQHEGGGLFAIDSSFLEQCCDDIPIIPDPFSNNGVVKEVEHVILEGNN